MSTNRFSNRTNRCEYCHQNFNCSRYNARYCSNKCRQAAYRWSKKVALLEKQIERLESNLRAFRHTEFDAAAADVALRAARRMRSIGENLES